MPVMVTEVPTGPTVGDKLLIPGRLPDVTVKTAEVLPIPPTVTITLPVVAPVGTGATICVGLQLVGVAAVPLKVTVLLPLEVPKPVPLMVTEVPTVPEVGERLVIWGFTVKGALPPAATLIAPLTVTTIWPLVAAPGTGTTTCVLLQLVGVAVAPLKVIVLRPWLLPKALPLMVTEVPTDPLVGEYELINGETVNGLPLLALPPTFTVTWETPPTAAEGTEL